MINTEEYAFPHPESTDEQGLLCMGGSLSPGRVLKAYQLGIFPWYQPGCPVLWWCPNPRLILYPNDLKISKSLQKSLHKPWRFTIDTAFQSVIEACATTNHRVTNTWITQEMIATYLQIHALGYAHSFEIWENERLIGGLYGISLGSAFFGESMFHIKKDASKVALFHLCETMKAWDFDFIDCQLPNAHLQGLGAKLIDRKDFLFKLQNAMEFEDKCGKWHCEL